MSEIAKNSLPVSLEQEMRNSYLDYAMSVIVGRALPDVRDGLKPVHRRVLFAMNQLKNDWNKPYKKSARVVGDVIGKYHPHGDSAVYETIVRMAQSFSLRYMLVDGQGNFGSIDGDNAAAMRYTEVRLTKIAHDLLEDLEKETVDFGQNYDGSENEPLVLPAKIPNLLVNGTSGIAVGMATNIPPHNLGEIVNGCLKLLENPELSIESVMEEIPAPDFPTAGVIYGTAGVKQGYKTGRGRVVMRAVTHFEEVSKNGKKAIIVDEIPFQVNKKSLLERIAELVNQKKLDGISDIRDESDKSGMRVVIELKRNESPEVVLNNLFKMTQLQDTFGMNLVALIDGQPKVLNLKQILNAFLSHRREVVTRKTVFELKKARERAFILEGLAIAVANMDPIVNLIRDAISPAEAKAKLLSKIWPAGVVAQMLKKASEKTVPEAFRPSEISADFGLLDDGYHLSEMQAQEILQMRLQRLTGLEQDKIIKDYQVVIELISDLLDILSNPKRISNIIKEELIQVSKDYGDERRSRIEESTEELQTEDLITPQDLIVTLSHEGYVKSQPVSEYRTQKKGGKGKQATTMKEDDWIEQLFIANTHDTLLGFSDVGRVYWMKVWEVPTGSRISRGRPIINYWPLAKGEKITTVLPVKKFDDHHFVFMATSSGIVKKTRLSSFSRPMKRGIIAATLKERETLVGATITDGKQDIMLVSDEGKAVRFCESDVRPMGRGSRGVKGMNLVSTRKIISMLSAPKTERGAEEESCDNGKIDVFLATKNGFGKRTSLLEFTKHGRGTKGMIAIQTSKRNGPAIGASLVDESDEIMLINNTGILVRIKVSEVRRLGRSTQGVRLIALNSNQYLVGFQRVSDTDVFADSEKKLSERE
ncbi:MAG: DNA gyrase subunit A [Betaproteobacteria bacterium TMED82]|nr:MAG: DNA gyrase subunit A [Betaproteobacteria bacterium TMED82]|tara:strand:- start:81701 stop:84322 length:2622 start_codon:yes stop_codon:yes gene_type:complete